MRLIDGLLLKLLPLIISTVSPTIKDMICSFIENLEAKAKETPNPWDNIAADLLRALICPK